LEALRLVNSCRSDENICELALSEEGAAMNGRRSCGFAWFIGLSQAAMSVADEPVDFVRDVQPIFAEKCVRCHGDDRQEGGLRLDVKGEARRGGDSGPVFASNAGEPPLLLQRISAQPGERMPPEGEPLSAAQIETLRRWIEAGAAWPDGVDKVGQAARYEWWSFRPMRGEKPQTTDGSGWGRTPIDDFIWQKLAEQGLSPSSEADRRTLYRRLSFDLLGLPPDPDDVDAFVADQDPLAYEKLVDRLLASPRYGERWARHWLDVVHYGDTHGYDKDKPRPNAWPYRDYVIRALNSDKPYARFVQEQIAGDVLWPETVDGLTATGFIAAGPWDFIGHAELPETKLDGQMARLMDRDDMVTNTFNTFCSLTVQCARCHHHKFDPVTQTDYYRLQAVFAALDRADRMFDADPGIARRRQELLARQREWEQRRESVEEEIARQGGTELAELDLRIAAAKKNQAKNGRPVAYGYHSGIEANQDAVKWVQVDFGKEVEIAQLELIGCHDDFNNIGAGFGFPVRYKVEVSNDVEFRDGVQIVVDATQADVPNPGITPLRKVVDAKPARYVRITATKLSPRMNDFIFALAELKVIGRRGENLAAGASVTALDSIEAPPRWQKTNLVDRLYPGVGQPDVDELARQRDQLLARTVNAETRQALADALAELQAVQQSLAELPSPQFVYAGMVHTGSGNFVGTGKSGGKPRPIHVLLRGDLRSPGEEVGPGFVPLSPDERGTFDLPPDHTEGDRRVALAKWITHPEHPLTWRSIVNRVWQYHFGRGIVDSPNDFGHMGRLPSHPELLDWLALEFRDHGGSLKYLHRLIVNSAVYRQSSVSNPDYAAKDSQNVFLWRMNRRRLEAEAVRDSVLHLAGKLNDRMFGPAFQDFVVVKPEHSPHYEYHLHDPEDPASHRRSVYRFLVRSQPQPFMTTLDCADPSMQVDKRNETVTALQALALLNNKLMLTMSRHAAERLRRNDDIHGQIVDLFRLALSRPPASDELAVLSDHALHYGLENACRVMFNLNEFVFVD
jgi:mono/diheme cytochrome c family protein